MPRPLGAGVVPTAWPWTASPLAGRLLGEWARGILGGTRPLRHAARPPMADQTGRHQPSPPRRRSSAASASRPRCARRSPRRWPGAGRLVLIGGEAGIGKTALAEALLAEAAEQGALVLVGRCYDLSETPPYGPWREALARAPAATTCPRCRRRSCRRTGDGGAREPGGALRGGARLPRRARRAPPAGPPAGGPALGRPRLPRPAARPRPQPRRPAAPPPRHLPRRRGDAAATRSPRLLPAPGARGARRRASTCARWTRRRSRALVAGALRPGRGRRATAGRLPGRAHRGQPLLPRASCCARWRSEGLLRPAGGGAGRSATWRRRPVPRCCGR